MLRLPVAMPELRISSDSLLGRLWGRSIDFESEIFNQTFDVHSAAPKLAHDVIHPRMMEFLLQAQPPELVIRGTMLVCCPPRHDLLEIGRLADLLTAFLARVPGFVWEDLGAPPPVVADAASAAAERRRHSGVTRGQPSSDQQSAIGRVPDTTSN